MVAGERSTALLITGFHFGRGQKKDGKETRIRRIEICRRREEATRAAVFAGGVFRCGCHTVGTPFFSSSSAVIVHRRIPTLLLVPSVSVSTRGVVDCRFSVAFLERKNELHAPEDSFLVCFVGVFFVVGVASVLLFCVCVWEKKCSCQFFLRRVVSSDRGCCTEQYF